tara:strand:- start:360 stop:812 length:453 start_codon:yes stop_codon:yes gene_type:complete
MEKVKYYTSIDDLPCLKYNYILEDHNLDHLIIEGKPSDKKLSQAWDIITNQIIDQHLKSSEYLESLKKQQRAALKQMNAQLSNSLADKIIAKQEEELQEKKDEQQFDFYEIISVMSKQLYPVNPSELSTRMYIVNLNILSKQSKQLSKEK